MVEVLDFKASAEMVIVFNVVPFLLKRGDKYEENTYTNINIYGPLQAKTHSFPLFSLTSSILNKWICYVYIL